MPQKLCSVHDHCPIFTVIFESIVVSKVWNSEQISFCQTNHQHIYKASCNQHALVTFQNSIDVEFYLNYTELIIY